MKFEIFFYGSDFRQKAADPNAVNYIKRFLICGEAVAKACVFIDAPCKVKEKQKKTGLYIIVFEEIF